MVLDVAELSLSGDRVPPLARVVLVDVERFAGGGDSRLETSAQKEVHRLQIGLNGILDPPAAAAVGRPSIRRLPLVLPLVVALLNTLREVRKAAVDGKCGVPVLAPAGCTQDRIENIEGPGFRVLVQHIHGSLNIVHGGEVVNRSAKSGHVELDVAL